MINILNKCAKLNLNRVLLKHVCNKVIYYGRVFYKFILYNVFVYC